MYIGLLIILNVLFQKRENDIPGTKRQAIQVQ